MATFLNRSNFSGSAGSHFFLDLYYDVLSTTSVRFYAYVGSIDDYAASGSSSAVYINGNYVGSISRIPAYSNTLVGSVDVSGSGSITGTASCTTPWTALGSASVTGTVQVGEFITSFTVTPRDETSVVYGFSTSSSADFAWYSLDGGAWNNLPIGGVVSGLTPGRTYTFGIKVRKTGTEATSEKYQQQTVYDYPKPSSTNDFVIGNGATVNLYNPLGRNVTLQILQANTNTVLGTYTGTGKGNINDPFKTEDAINRQYASIPNSKTGTYYAKVTYGSITKTSGNKTYSIRNTEVPVVTVSAEDTDKTLTSGIDPTVTVSDLTNDSTNKTIIKFISDLEVTTTATTQNSSTLRTITTKCDGNLQTGSTSPFTYTYTNVEGNEVSGSATDSRTLSTTVNVTGLTIVPYVLLTMDDLELYRDDETSSTLKCKGNGNYYSGSFGSNGVNNSITFEIRTKEPSQSWDNINWTTKTVTIGSSDDYLFDFSIGTSYDYTKTYNVQVRATDKCMTTGIIETTAKPGIPVQGLFENFQEAFGTKTFEKDNNGDVKFNVDLVYPIGSIYMSVNSANPATYFGGTWEAWGSGRVPVGVDTTQTEFDTVEETGGSKYMQQHYHQYTMNVGGSLGISDNNDRAASMRNATSTRTVGGTITSAPLTSGGSALTTGSSGNLQPYITCYMWKRTA